MRRVVLVTHRWLGLSTSLVLSVVGATGVVLVAADSVPARVQRVSSRLHESLALRAVGNFVVDAATVLSVFLLLGGLVLWWRRKSIAVSTRSGWWRLCFDVHHAIGIVCLPMMLVLAVTAVVMAQLSPSTHPEVWRLARRLHTGHFGLASEVIYGIGSFGFVAQGLTGLVVWWRK